MVKYTAMGWLCLRARRMFGKVSLLACLLPRPLGFDVLVQDRMIIALQTAPKVTQADYNSTRSK